MKKNEFLQDAIGLIGDDLILDAKSARASKRKKYTWAKWGAMAASILLIVTCVFAFLNIERGPAVNLPVAENLWQQENFQAFSLSYKEGATAKNMSLMNPLAAQPLSLSAKEDTRDGTIASTALSITQPNTIKLESLIAERYAVYYTEQNVPVVYDIQEDREVNLEERIIGDERLDVEGFVNTMLRIAEERYPGMVDTENNRQHIREYAYSIMDFIWTETISPDLGFLDNYEEYRDLPWERKLSKFYEIRHDVFAAALVEIGAEFTSDPLSVQLIAFDAINGVCMVRVRDLVGNGLDYMVYDIVTDTYQELPVDAANSILSITTTSGYRIRFSTDASVITVTSPNCYIDGENVNFDLTKPFLDESLHRQVEEYMGENIGVFYPKADVAYRLETEEYMGASEAYISGSGSIIYYKQMKPESMGKTFYCSNAVWWNRLQLFPQDTDFWVFCSVNTNLPTAEKKTVLQGNFVRFIADETAVIMERDGTYYAYSLEDGRDITEAVANGKVNMMAHERLLVYKLNGKLYKKDMFSGRNIAIANADDYVLSNDGAFAFVYNDGDAYVTCINVASLESTRISIGDVLCEQIFGTEHAVFRMLYNETENTILFSFYVDDSATAETEGAVDFFGAVEDYNLYSGYGKTFTDVTVSEDVMASFRRSADLADRNAIYGSTADLIYPCGMTEEDSKESVFAKLGITPPADYLDVNGTEFILYEDEDETLSLQFKKGWVLYDFPEEDAGFAIEYVRNGKIYYYSF